MVQIDQMACTGCEACIPYCPVGAIKADAGTVGIDFDACVECAVCLRFSNCPAEAIQESPETSEWPRIIRRQFSDPFTPHASTGRRGRGTGGVKTNDVTGELGQGQISLRLEFGRPARGTTLREVEKMTTRLAALGVYCIPKSPLAALMMDGTTGEMKPEVLDERVLTAPVEVHITADQLEEILPTVREVASKASTVITWGITVRLSNGAPPPFERLRGLGITPRSNGKVNLGMGRPLAAN